MKHKLVRRVVALALSFTLALSLFAPIMVSANDDVVYQLATDEHIQSMAVGTTGNGRALGITDDGNSPATLQSVGPSTYTIIDAPGGGNGIMVSGRNDTWQGLDIKVGGSLDKPGLTLGDGNYTIRVRGSIVGSGKIQLAGGDSPQSGFFGQDVSGEFSIEHTFTFAGIRANGVHTRGLIRINTTQGNGNISITEIVIASGDSIPSDLPAYTGPRASSSSDATGEGGLATWQDVLDTGIFSAIKGHATGNPTLAATGEGLVLSGRHQTEAYGEHDGLGIDLRSLRALGSGSQPPITISGKIGGTADKMYAQFFDAASRGDDGWLRAEIGADGSFTFNITDQNHGPASWASAWADRNWIGAHPRGDITVTEILIDGVSILEILGDEDTVVTQIEDEKITFPGLPAGVVYSMLQDANVQGLDNGTIDSSFPDIEYLRGSGSFEATIVANPYGGKAIQVTERQEEYAGIDYIWNLVNIPDGDYVIQVIGMIALEDAYDPATFVIAGSSNPWGWIGEEEFPDENNGFFVMEREFSVEGENVTHEVNGNIGGNIRLRPIDCDNDFMIFQIAIKEAGTQFPTLPALGALPAFTSGGGAPGNTTSSGAAISLVIGNINAMVNGAVSVLDSAPFISDEGRTMVPLRFISEAMGADIGWDDATKTVTITPPGGAAINMVVGQELAGGMGTPEIRDSRTFVPVRFISEAMGGQISFDDATKTVTILLGGASAPPAATVPSTPTTPPEPGEGGEGGSGFVVSAVEWGNEASFANIIIGNNTAAWPYSTGGDEEGFAFIPEQGATYRISFNVTNQYASGFRVRWFKTAAYGDHTARDAEVVNDHEFSATDVANVIPALFNSGIEEDETYTLVVEITLDGSQTADQLIGNIGLRGLTGSNDWYLNWVKIEKDGQEIASWSNPN